MKKRLLSAIMAVSLVISCSVTAYAGEAAGLPAGSGEAQGDVLPEEQSQQESGESVKESEKELMDWIDSIGDYTEESANAYTPTELKNLMEPASSDKESVIDKIEKEKDTDSSVTDVEFVEGEVLYSKRSGKVSLFSGSLDAELKSIGVSSPEEVVSFTDDELNNELDNDSKSDKKSEKSGLASLFSGSSKSSDETVWYKAKVSGDVKETVEKLKEIDGIENAEPNYIYKSESYGKPTEAETSNSWSFDKLMKNGNSNDLWWDKVLSQDKAPGEGVVVAVIDTGVDYNHEDLKANMWVNTAELNGKPGVDDDGDGYIDDIYGINTTAMGKQAGDPMDDNGHGTHVAGIIGMSANGKGGVGLAWGAKIMAIKAGQSTGTFASSDIAKAIDYAHNMGADVINMSFGGTGKSYLIEQALASAFSDCVLVAAAGNDGCTTTDGEVGPQKDIYPAAYSYVLGVMATDESGELASFSNWDYCNNSGPEYELTAPGVNIYSTLPNNHYAKWSGTSMAAPCVAAAAAIVRSQFADKDMFSSRIIMGQLVSATNDNTIYVDKINKVHVYGALNILNSCQNMPKPNISVKEVFALDNVTDSNKVNDADRVIDAGETIDLGITVRNQWGQTGDITIKADAVSDGGVVNPYVTFEKDTINIDPAGTFAESNNGYVWDDSLLTDIKNPIRFKVTANTPNDAEIKINLTVTTTNGYGDDDTTIYTVKSAFTFRVQNGRAIKGTLTENVTLSSDYYWIVEDKILIPKGIIMTVEPGTIIQFWSSDYEDVYGEKTMAGIVNSGTLNMVGKADEPIEMFPGDGFESDVVEIAGDGNEILKYCNIINPRLGCTALNVCAAINNVDHCNFIQNNDDLIIRYIENNIVKDDYLNIETYGFIVEKLSNTICSGFRSTSSASFGTRAIYIKESYQNLFNDCYIKFENSYLEKDNDTWFWSNYDKINCDSVIMRGNGGGFERKFPNTIVKNKNEVPKVVPKFSDKVYTYDGSKSKYIFLNSMSESSKAMVKPVYFQMDLAKAIAQSMGGTLLCLNNDLEKEFITSAIHDELQSERNENVDSTWKHYNIGYEYDYERNVYVWQDGNDYKINVNDNGTNYLKNVYMSVYDTSDYTHLDFYQTDYIYNNDYILEVPSTLTDEQIKDSLSKFNYNDWIFNYIKHDISNCAILNPVLNNDETTWTKIIPEKYNNNILCHNVSGNYWGTEDKALINKMIIDADDYPGVYGDIVEDPILTLNSESLSEIYPFSTAVWLEDRGGNKVSSAAPGETYKVHVTYNRDMDQTVQPTVTYGPDAPYTDYSVKGSWVSAREWVGETYISPVMTSGTQYFKTTGGRAADDHWLVCGNDILRFAFDVSDTGALAMVLNASGGANKVELSWAQNDYDTLAGYNLYRSTDPDGEFVKINGSILTGTSYTDTDVEPGVKYYYYFKTVNTDGNEEANRSNVASAAPIDNVDPTLRHTPVKTSKANSSVVISATATDNIAVAGVTLYYRTKGETSYKSLNMVAGDDDRYVATIPAAAVVSPGVEYYVEARDGYGNAARSGTAERPNEISVDGKPYITGVTPVTVETAGGSAVTVLGGNFTEDMTVTVGGAAIESYTLVDSGQITFIAPAKTMGSYEIVITASDGTQIKAPVMLSYTDKGSIVQIATDMEMKGGKEFVIPVYVSAGGELNSFHIEMDMPYWDFPSIEAEMADGIEGCSLTTNYDYETGTFKIGGASAGNILPADGKPLINIKVMPNSVTSDKTVDIKLHDVQLNGAAVDNVISGRAVIRPNFSLTAMVNYFRYGYAVSGVNINAGGVEAVTDSEGRAELTGITKDQVDVIASKDDYVHNVTAIGANDAVLVLQSAVGLTELDESQKLAGDVDGNGIVNEADAARILKYAVGLDKVFPAGSWRFIPEHQSTWLGTGMSYVSFTAVLTGDVDGSWRSE